MNSSPALVRAAQSGTAIGIAQLATYALGCLVSVSIAAQFGTSTLTDAYFMAASTAELLAKILLGGALASVLLPVFIEALTKGDPDRAWRLFSALFSLALVSFVLLGGLLEILAPSLMSFLAPGFSDDTRALTVTLLRVVLPAYLFAFLADLATVPLHAHRRFGLPAISRLIVPILTLLTLLTLARRLGVVTLAIGTVAGTAIQVGTLLAALRGSGYTFRFSLRMRDPDVRRVLALTFPFVISILAAHGAGAVYRILISHEPPGSLASLKFGEKIYQLCNTLFFGTITQVAFPALARAAATSDEILRHRFAEAARAVVFLGIPVTVGIILLREPLVRLLFERGAFTAESTTATALLVPFLIIGILGNGLSSLLGHVTLALQATRISVGVNIALQAIAASLFVFLTPSLGVKGIALTSGLGPFVLLLLYLWALRSRGLGLGAILLDKSLLRLFAAGAVCMTLVVASTTLLERLSAGTIRDVLVLSVGGIVGATSYLAAAWLLRVPETGLLKELFVRSLYRLRHS